MFAATAFAKDDLDLFMWPESVREAAEKAEALNEQGEEGKGFVTKDFQWITHDYEDGISKAEPKKMSSVPKAIKLDGLRYLPHSIILSFLNAAFSNSIWYEDASSAGNSIIFLKWKSPEIKSLPRHHVINKWRQPLKIAFKTLENNYQVDKEKYAYLIDHLKVLISIYSKASGLDISYVYEEYPNRSDANVFIVLNAKSKILNAFKNQRRVNYPDENDYERSYISGVRFTPLARSQVEGFFIPNSNNEIQRATCYLKPAFVPEEWSKALLAECIGRVLGLPEFSTSNNGLLSNWNYEFDSFSELSALDGISHYDTTYKSWLTQVTQKFDQKSPVTVKPIEFDLKLLTILYCPSVESGMDEYGVALSLIRNPQCVD
tara:strand:- start:5321 stop:6445 length:1125 start_codon:yes stop_codon:yes gene_type:complete